ncbi:2-phospho-L-lactate transferase [Actinomadura rudentiformis]|uniref:2-phospho-L-lactate transferase n=1 Tax=Actinomadura rudentiformis TaxID=359158 RepID=A0A6H9Z803_9ACTN|nr:2-phospho-L-lactate transferase [Actinomadura rudentiformis]KAB2351528.1 2-phospho-L-lactate transferase [Actinomadura rudentiformis]
MRIVALAGGIGGARFLRGLQAAAPAAEITVIGNTGDDITLFGLRVCPDLDTVMYTLGGGINEAQGWGRTDESFTVKEELLEYGVGPSWFGLGDRDFATHIVRTQMLAAGYPLSAVTEALCDRWQPGVRLIPMTDDQVETHVVIDELDTGRSDGAGWSGAKRRRAIHFQEWWVRLRASIPAESIALVGAEDAKPAPGVLEAIEAADVVLFPPSNPVVSIGTILSVPGVRAAVAAKTVVGVSPIIGGAPVRGMADACLTAIGVETSAQAVAELYGPELVNGWLVAEADSGVRVDGMEVRSRPLLMSDPEATAAIARAALDLAEELA